jgi:hypothetical protein
MHNRIFKLESHRTLIQIPSKNVTKNISYGTIIKYFGINSINKPADMLFNYWGSRNKTANTQNLKFSEFRILFVVRNLKPESQFFSI